jgi:hypothetical protein
LAAGASGHGSTLRGAVSIESDFGVADGFVGAGDTDRAGDVEDATDGARDGVPPAPQPAVTRAIDRIAAMQSQARDGVRDDRAIPSSSMRICPSMNEASQVIA